MQTLLGIRNLSKRFGPIVAVDDVSFQVARGEVVGFLGPNAAGKTTTMRMVAGYLPPGDGSVAVCGHDVVRDAHAAQARIGYMPEGAPSYGDMSALSLLRFVTRIRGLSAADRKRRIDEVIDRLHLEGVLHRPVETLSKGFKRRVGLAAAIVHDPDVLILDEPTDGLDPNQKYEVRNLLREIAGNKAIIISTHILEEVEAICSRAIIIARGQVVADALPDELQARAPGHNAVYLSVAADREAAARSALEAVEGVARIDALSGNQQSARLLAVPADQQDILDAVRKAVANDGIEIQEIRLERGRLDDIFRELTKAA